MTYGLTPTGLVVPTTEELLADIQADQLTNVDPGLNQDPTEPLGQFNGIFASKLVDAYQVLDTIYEGFDPDKSEGDQLTANAALTGTTKLPASYSLVNCVVTVGASFSAPPGTMVASVTGQPNVKFVNRDTVTTATATGLVVFRSMNTGPVAANATTLTTIATSVSGWTSINNPHDAVLGSNAESDTALKIRRVEELTRGGSSGIESIRAALLDPTLVPGIISCTVLENVNGATDLNTGLPGHSFCAVIWDGPSNAADNLTIAETIWQTKPSGIQPYGVTSVSIFDSNGQPQTVAFTRATQRPVYLAYTVKVDVNSFPADGVTEIKNAAIALAAASIKEGSEVYALAFRTAALSVPGVLDVPSFALDFSPSPVATANLNLGPFEIATFDTTHISVTVTS